MAASTAGAAAVTSTFENPSLLSNCTVDICPIDSSYYSYRLDLAPNVAFLVFFCFSFLAFLAIGLVTRRGLFFMAAMLLGLTAELVGYVGRILSYSNQWNQSGFLIQIVCLTVGPAFFAAAVYVCLARIIIVFGRENSRMPPEWYTRTVSVFIFVQGSLIYQIWYHVDSKEYFLTSNQFIPCDILSLILQGAGGTVASVALVENQPFTTGDDVMIAGLSSQVFTLFVFMLLSGDFALSVWRRTRKLGGAAALTQEPTLVRIRSSWQFRGFIGAITLATVTIFWRSVYRVAELNQGWSGPLTYNQGLFVGFEGVLVVIAVAALGVFHPVLCLGEAMDGKWLGKGKPAIEPKEK